VICGDIVHKENKMTMINILGTLVNRDQVNYIGEYDKGDDFSIGIKIFKWRMENYTEIFRPR
jgi:hypothetical protein